MRDEPGVEESKGEAEDAERMRDEPGVEESKGEAESAERRGLLTPRRHQRRAGRP